MTRNNLKGNWYILNKNTFETNVLWTGPLTAFYRVTQDLRIKNIPVPLSLFRDRVKQN